MPNVILIAQRYSPMSCRSYFFLLFFSLIYSNQFYAMLVFGQVGVSPDKSKYIAYLGHYHGKISYIEAQQLQDLVSICKEGVQQGKKFHILYEKMGDLIKFEPVKGVLSHLEKVFAEAQVPNCTIENVEIRDASAAALHILDEKEKVLEYSKLTWNNQGSKPLEEISFQDLFDEFERHALEIKPFVDKVVQENADCPNSFLIIAKYEDSYRNLNELKKLLAKKSLSHQEKILNLALENNDKQRIAFEQMVRWAFSALFDLHIFRRLSQLDPDIQPIVITGGMHSIEAASLFNDLKWESQLIRGMLFVDEYKPLSCDAMRSIILNETEWALRTKDVMKYLASIKLSLEARFQSLRAYLL